MNCVLLPIDQIELDLQNPRIKKWIEMYGTNVSSEAISLALHGSNGNESNSYNALKESIRVNGGIIHPIVVNKKSDGKLVVIEGNTRLQIYKEFSVSDPNGPWKEILAIVHENMPEDQIHSIRLQSHLVGPRDWDAFSKAMYLYELSEIKHMPITQIISQCGGKEAEIRKYIDAYNDMMNYYAPLVEKKGMDIDPKEFSKYAELQNRSVLQALVAHGKNKHDFSEWVINGNIDTAQNVRELGKVLDHKEAHQVFLDSNLTEATKHLGVGNNTKALEKASIYELVQELIKRFRVIEHRYIKSLKNDPAFENEKNDIYTLCDSLKDIIDDLEN